jgi:cytochrome c
MTRFRHSFGLAGLGILLSVSMQWAPVRAGTPAGRGKLLFLRCASCHDISTVASAKTGPNLYHVFGRKSASLAGYSYSPAMQNAHLVWDAPTLDRWLTNPASVVPGTAMAFPGFSSAQDRQAVIAYLKAQP